VGDGRQAFEAIKKTRYDLVLMDCQMPEMDGYEATRRIRRAGRAHVPIIALTAGASNTERQLAVEAGMDAFVSKPVHRDELARVLEELLSTTKPVHP
jgi:CheY-like chemotaxis protein